MIWLLHYLAFHGMGSGMDERTVKKLQNKAKQAQLARDDFVKAAVGTAQGREYLAWIMGLGQPNANPYAGNALATAFRCGEANVSQLIVAHLLATAPEGYFNILREQQKEAYNGPELADTSPSAYAADPDAAEPDTAGTAL